MLPVLIPILASVGAPILKSILENEIGGDVGKTGSVVVDALATALGVDPTPEAIEKAHQADPTATEAVIKQVEESGEAMKAFVEAMKSRDALLAADNGKGLFYDGWRPGLSWTLIFLSLWTWVLVPLVNAVFHAQVAGMAPTELVQFAALWLTIYGGGHTVKDVFGKMYGGGQ